MKITKGKVILAIVIVYFAIFAVININKEKNYNKEILDQVVYVTDGKVNPENEGKVVLVSGKIEYDELVTFLELDSFETIKINRKVEDYLRVTDRDGRKTEKWVERVEVEDEETDDYLKTIVSDEKVAKVRIGEFELDEKGLSLIPTDSFYHGQEKIGDLLSAGFWYERDPEEETLKVGDMKLTYQYYDLEKNPNLSILAVQKGNSFEPYKVDKKTEVYQVFTKKVDAEDKLTIELNKNVKNTTKGKTLFVIMILIVGVFLIVDNKKKEK